MNVDLKDWLNSINHSKKNLIDEDPDVEKKYPAYIINRCMSGHLDAIMYANEMNLYHNLNSKLQYDFLLNILRSKKRFSPWVKKEELKNLAVEGWGEFEGNSPHRPWIDKVKIKHPESGLIGTRIPDVGNPWLDAGIVPFSTFPSHLFFHHPQSKHTSG